MWNRNEVLLATICFTALLYDVTAGLGELLDSPSGVVDDLYSGCRQQAMEKFIQSGLLKQELNNSMAFQKAWILNSKCSAVIPGGIKAHTSALSTYVLAEEDGDFVKAFGKEVQTMGVNVSTYENDFHFKSLHFLLMDAMTLLKPKTCQTMFVLQEENRIPKKGSVVRFGRFTVVTSNFLALKKLEDFEGRVLLNITSCFFVSAGEHICNKDGDKVLLSPAEDFIVEEVIEKEDDNESQYTEIVLKASHLNSTHNCFIFSRSPAAVSALWLPFVFAIFSFLYSTA